MGFKKLKVKKVEIKDSSIPKQLSVSCLDCDWQGDAEDAETDYLGDYNEFSGSYNPTKICPECGGGVEID